MALAEDTAKLDDLFTRLKSAGAEEASRIETEIWIEWSKSGSPALDLLLLRGRDAMELGDSASIEHSPAIIAHDPALPKLERAGNRPIHAGYSAYRGPTRRPDAESPRHSLR